jgi:hypothetical protein
MIPIMFIFEPPHTAHHCTFIVKKGPPPEFNPYNCAAALHHIAHGVLSRISVPWYFFSMIFGGEMSKISHGVGCRTVAIFGGCAMWLFFEVARKQFIPTSNLSHP